MKWKDQTIGEKIIIILGAIGTIVFLIFAIYYINKFFHSVYAGPVILIGLVLYAFAK